jgi:hypothetical protein
MTKNKFLKQYPQLVSWEPKVGDKVRITDKYEGKYKHLSPKYAEYKNGDIGLIVQIEDSFIKVNFYKKVWFFKVFLLGLARRIGTDL